VTKGPENRHFTVFVTAFGLIHEGCRPPSLKINIEPKEDDLPIIGTGKILPKEGFKLDIVEDTSLRKI
jgi:hypothetical protein